MSYGTMTGERTFIGHFVPAEHTSKQASKHSPERSTPH